MERESCLLVLFGAARKNCVQPPRGKRELVSRLYVGLHRRRNGTERNGNEV